MYYTICLICGHILCKGKKTEGIEIFCPKCGQKLLIEITEDSVTTKLVKKNDKKKV